MAIFAKDSGRRLRTPAAQARIAIRGITHQRQIVRDRLRRNTKFLDYTRLVQRNARPPIQLNDTRAAHALGEVLIWCAQNHSFTRSTRASRSATAAAAASASSASNSTIGQTTIRSGEARDNAGRYDTPKQNLIGRHSFRRRIMKNIETSQANCPYHVAIEQSRTNESIDYMSYIS